MVKIYKYLLTENYEYDINNFKEIKVTEAIPLTLMLYLDTSNVANR